MHAFAFDRALEALTMHSKTWPILLELTNDRPRLATPCGVSIMATSAMP